MLFRWTVWAEKYVVKGWSNPGNPGQKCQTSGNTGFKTVHYHLCYLDPQYSAFCSWNTQIVEGSVSQTFHTKDPKLTHISIHHRPAPDKIVAFI